MIERESRALHVPGRHHKHLLIGSGTDSLGFLTGAAYVLTTGFEDADHAAGYRFAYEAARRHGLHGAEAAAFERAALTAIDAPLSTYRGAA